MSRLHFGVSLRRLRLTSDLWPKQHYKLMDTCEVFETKRKNTFVFVRKEDDLGKMSDATKKRLAPFRHFKTVDLETTMIAADSKKILKGLAADGYSVNSVEIQFRIR